MLGTRLARIPPQIGMTAREDDALPADAGVHEDTVLAPIALAHEQRGPVACRHTIADRCVPGQEPDLAGELRDEQHHAAVGARASACRRARRMSARDTSRSERSGTVAYRGLKRRTRARCRGKSGFL